MRPKRKVEQLSATIEKLLVSRGLASKLKEYQVFGHWGRAVGELIAQHAQPSAVRGKKLTVTVDSSAWMQQLALLKPEVIEKLNAALGKNAVDSITLKLGEPDIPPRRRARTSERTLPPLGPDEVRKVDELASSIRDPEVRAAFQRLVELDLRARKAKRA